MNNGLDGIMMIFLLLKFRMPKAVWLPVRVGPRAMNRMSRKNLKSPNRKNTKNRSLKNRKVSRAVLVERDLVARDTGWQDNLVYTDHLVERNRSSKC